MPGPFDNGVMRFAWVAPLVTNWMGDNGFLRKLYVQVRTPNIYGDTTWYRGKIVEKTVEDGKGIVRLDITGVNQVGITTTQGRAEVMLQLRFC
jgi:acyl dehydratase